MTEPISPVPDLGPAAPGRGPRVLGRLASLALVLEIALALRVVAADAVEWYVRRGDPGRLCVFDDTNYYWELARAIRAGDPYQIVEWGDIPHFALRTPGYPLVLAACQAVFGEQTLAVRLVQAVFGTLSVYLVYVLARQFSAAAPEAVRHRWTIPLIAAAIAAVNPYYLLLSSLILSEAVFEPLMLASLWGLAVLWTGSSTGPGTGGAGVAPAVCSPGLIAGSKRVLLALGTGAAAGAAVLVRPSWAPFVPAMLAAWVVAKRRDRRNRAAALRGAMLCLIGVVVVMGPWWYRNWQVYGRFVPTALWFGASLYDGINPKATGASDMLSFLRDPQIWPLDEQDQDAVLTRRAVVFAREQPWRVLRLALVKLGRYWSPWPNAEGFRSRALAVASAVVELPLFALILLGLYDRRRDPRAWVLLAGPLFYFCALHMVFASSMRYRIPGEMPASGLAAIGFSLVMNHRSLVMGGRRKQDQ
jgi:4-amino-4-deoxy-L-arabinose transferase-like glycosyltransferase